MEIEFEWKLAKIIIFEELSFASLPSLSKAPGDMHFVGENHVNHLDKLMVYEYLSDVIVNDFSNKKKYLILDKSLYEQLPKFNKFARRIENYSGLNKTRKDIYDFWMHINFIFFEMCSVNSEFVVVYTIINK